MRPSRFLDSPFGEAFAKGYRSARQNLVVMLVLLAAMSAVVAIYYGWPAGAAFLSWYGAWQTSGGILRAGLISGLAGGVLSELTLVYLRDWGRWNLGHLDNMAFRFGVFFIGGMAVFEFYIGQAHWFGNGVSWRVLLPKVIVDQFVFSAFWSTPYQAITFRWHALGYSGRQLWKELDGRFIIDRMLPVLVTNWMFWIPGVVLVYSMPLLLQMPMNIFATAIWSLLLAGLAKPAKTPENEIQPEPLVP